MRLTLLTEPTLPPREETVPPEVSLVVDDNGALDPDSTLTYAYQMLNQMPNNTYAVIPDLAYSTGFLMAANLKSIETILHQPMQYVGQPDTDPSDTTRLYTGQTGPEIKATFDANLKTELPFIIGMNNHQGSRFSQYAAGLNVVLDDMKSRNLIFYDSRTISDSLAYDIARQKGILTAERSLFVDASSAEQTRQNIDSVALRALYSPNYNYLMIGHPRPESVPGFLLAQADLATSGIAMKPLSRNLHYIIETDNIPADATVDYEGAWTMSSKDMISHECTDGSSRRLEGLTSGSVAFQAALPKPGNYRVFEGSAGGDTATTAARVTINHVGGSMVRVFDQSTRSNRWRYLGTYGFNETHPATVVLDNSLATDPQRELQADSIKLVYDGQLPPTEVENWAEY
jgi:polysaccharide deacetylase 2 family uncharacterized protein YibQ